MILMLFLYCLLIEPVWNRKMLTNREVLYPELPSNRTSLEQKVKGCKHRRGSYCRLLIEPVWNRKTTIAWIVTPAPSTSNRTSLEQKVMIRFSECPASSSLLIEPVWNRKADDCLLLLPPVSLLIEPVWNRKGRLCERKNGSGQTSNRTSLEQKESRSGYAARQQLPSNRTSLEQKVSLLHLQYL